MKRTFFLGLGLLLLTQTLYAQKTVEEIRQYYNDVKAGITEMGKPDVWLYEGGYPPCYFNVQYVDNYPGTGPHHENVFLYFGEEGGEEGEVFPPKYLKLVTSQYNFAARQYYEEYLFDKKGNILFIYRMTPDIDEKFEKMHELRYYFNKGKLLKCIVKESPSWENPTDFKEVYNGSKVPAYLERELEWSKAKADQFKDLFDALDVVAYQ